MDTKIKVTPEEMRKRTEAFQKELKELLEKHKIVMKPQITLDGPIISLFSTE